MFKGYLSLGGTELVNAARTQAYVDSLIPGFPLRKTIEVGELREALGDAPYTNPLADDAPWADGNNPFTWGFYGLYPLDIQGAENSTLENDVTQSILDGGFVGRTRYGTKEIRVKALLVAKNELALQAGWEWLNAALAANGCSGDDCGAQPMCFYTATPGILLGDCDPDDTPPPYEMYERHFNDVTTTVAPSVTTEIVRRGVRGVAYAVEFGLTAANPWTFTTADTIGTMNITMGVTPSQTIWDQGRLIATNLFTDPLSLQNTANFTGFVSGGSMTLAFNQNASSMVGWPVLGDVAPPGGGGGVSTPAASAIVLTATSVGSYAQILSSAFLVKATPGTTYYGQVYAADTIGAAGAAVGIMQWFDASGAVIATSTLGGQTMGVSNPAFPPGKVNEILCSGVAPAGAAWVGMGVRYSGAVPSGYKLTVNAWQVETGTWTDWFFGGAQPRYWPDPTAIYVHNTFRWTGSTNGSSSQRFADWQCGVDARTNPIGVTTPSPPRPPSISSAVVTTTNWNRYFIPIPAGDVSLWSSMVPTITVTAPGGAVIDYAVRMRVMENPFNRDPSTLDYCNFCGEWLISIMPKQTTVTIDGENERSVASVQGGPLISADTLIYGTGGSPMQWPELSCGIPYVLAIDTPRTGSLQNVQLTVTIEMSRKS